MGDVAYLTLMPSGAFGGAILAQEIGVAYISLLPSSRGFKAATEKQTAAAFDGASRKSDGFFGKLAKGAVGVITTAVGTLAAVTAGKGIARALNIEDAQAKLKGLGHDTKTVETIMNDALASVKGTAFGLDSAATTAASAVAAGIKPGQELERYLRLTADAATIAGSSMEEMGGIINQVTSKGYAGMENLNRLTERGIPIMQWLAAEYGVTADELSKMVSRGEVDAATFRKVIEDNIGGAALASGETTRGAIANVGAALGRLGAMFAGPGLGIVRDFLNEVIVIIDGIGTRLSPVVENLQGQIDGIDFTFGEGVLETIDRITAGFRSLSDMFSGFSGLTPLFTTLAGAMAPLLNSLPLIGRFLPAISGPIGAVVGLLAGLLIESEPLRDSLAGLAEEIGGSLTAAFGGAGDSLSSFGPMISELLQVLGSGLADAITALTPTVGLLIEAFGQVLAVVSPLFEPLMQIVTAALSLLGPLGELIGAILPPLIELFMAVLGPVVELAGTILTALMPVIDGLVQVLTGLIEFVIGVFTGNWEQAWTGIQTVFQGVINTIGSIFTGLGELIGFVANGWVTTLSGVVGWLQSTFSGAFRALVGFFGGIWANISSGVRNAWNGVMSFLGSIPNRIRGFFSGIGTWLVDSGRALIQGFINGIKGMVGAVGNAVGGVMDFVGGFFPHSPAKRGPFSGSGWTAVGEGGESLIDQFAGGIEKRTLALSFGDLPSILQSVAPEGMPGLQSGDTMRLVVDGHEFNAYVDTRSDGRIRKAVPSRVAVHSEFG